MESKICHLYFHEKSNRMFYMTTESEELEIYNVPLRVFFKKEDIKRIGACLEKTFNFHCNADNIYSLARSIKQIKSKNMNIDRWLREFVILDRSDKYKDLYGNPLTFIEFKPGLRAVYDEFKKFLVDDNISFFGTGSDRGLYMGSIPVSSKIDDRRIWFLDIETDIDKDSDGEIISIQIYDSHLKRYMIFVLLPEAERKHYRIANKMLSSNIETEEGDKVGVIYFLKESDLLDHFITVFKSLKPNIISGWASNWFDIPYIINRLKKYPFLDFSLIKGIKPFTKQLTDLRGKSRYYSEIGGVELIDYKEIYQKYSFENQASWSLDNIADYNEIKGKTQIKGFLEYKKDFSRFMKYIIQDVKILVMLEEKKRFLKMMCGLQNFINVPLSKMMKNSIFLALYFDQEAFKNYLAIESYKENSENDSDDETYNSVMGANVLQPENKTFENVIVLDFASLYPNCIVSANMSPEKLNNVNNNILDLNILLEDEGFLDMDIRFDQREPGFIPTLVKNLLTERLRYKSLSKTEEDPNLREEYDVCQINYKILLNSIYGVLGFRKFPLFNINIAQAITAFARAAFNFAGEKFNDQTFEFESESRKYLVKTTVIYGDTDSQFIKIEPLNNEVYNKSDILNISNHLINHINNSMYELPLRYFKNNIPEEYDEYAEIIKERCSLKMDLDKVFKKVRIFSKKRYFGYDFDRTQGDYNKLPIFHGVEVVRTDVPKCFQIRKKGGFGIIQELFYRGLDGEITEEYLLNLYEEIKTFPADTLFIPQKVNNLNFERYKTIPNHIRSLLFWQDITSLEFSYNDSLMYYYVKLLDKTYEPALRKRFNITKKTLSNTDYLASVSIESSHLNHFLEMLKDGKVLQIDYYTLFEKEILGTLKQFTDYLSLINDISNLLYYREFGDNNQKDFKQMKLDLSNLL